MEPYSDPFLEPGALVRHPARDDWGLGQVQSVAGPRVWGSGITTDLVMTSDSKLPVTATTILTAKGSAMRSNGSHIMGRGQAARTSASARS